MSELTIEWQANSGIKRTVKVPQERGAALLSSKLDAPSLVPYPVAVAVEDGWIICVPAGGSEGQIEQASRKIALADFAQRLVWVAKNVPAGKPNEIEVWRFKFGRDTRLAVLKVPGGQLTISSVQAQLPTAAVLGTTIAQPAAVSADDHPLAAAPANVAPVVTADMPDMPVATKQADHATADSLDASRSTPTTQPALTPTAAESVEAVRNVQSTEVPQPIQFDQADSLGVLAEDYEPVLHRRRAIIFKMVIAVIIGVGIWLMLRPSADKPLPFANPFEEPAPLAESKPAPLPAPPAPAAPLVEQTQSPPPLQPTVLPEDSAQSPSAPKPPQTAKVAPAPPASSKVAALKSQATPQNKAITNQPPPAKKPTGIRVEAGKFTAEGKLARAEIAAFVDKNLRGLTSCYEDGLKSNPNLQGNVTVAFKILPDGRVSQQEVQATTIRNAEVESCMLKRIRRWIFPKPESGSVAVEFSFLLTTGK